MITVTMLSDAYNLLKKSSQRGTFIVNHDLVVFRRRNQDMDDDNDDSDVEQEALHESIASKLLAHRKNLLRTKRKIQLMLSGLLVAAAENLPLGILQVVYSQRIASHLETMDMLSLITSW